MILYVLYAVTPLLGFTKNYVKYKRVNVALFARTPLLYFLIDSIMRYYRMNNIILWTLILERWFFFYYKITHAYLYDHYRARREKYIQKYGLIYSSDGTRGQSS